MKASPATMRDSQENSAASSAKNSSFYTAMRIMPPGQREAMYEIYSFCRAIDDIADDEGQPAGRLEALQDWRRDIARIYENNSPEKLRGLAKAIAQFSLRKDDFLTIIDGMEMDVNGPIQAPDFATLERYCDCVASAVGRLSVRVFGLEEQDGLQLSHHLGFALQLTNILRDIDEDAALNRLYLPKELLQNSGIFSSTPAGVIAHPALEPVCNALAEKALTHFREADAIMRRYERSKVRTPRVMSQAYRAIHTALVERGFAAPRQPVKLGKAKLGYILVRNIIF